MIKLNNPTELKRLARVYGEQQMDDILKDMDKSRLLWELIDAGVEGRGYPLLEQMIVRLEHGDADGEPAAATGGHTAGPWAVVGELRRNSHNEPYAVIQTSLGAFDLVAPRIMEDSHMANARLIAAAPAMFEALSKLVAADNCNYGRAIMRSEGYFDAARAALAEASCD